MAALAILITGANQGIGYGAARHLSKHSHVRLFVSGRNPSRVQEAVEKIKKEDGCQAIIESVILDVSNDDSINAAVKDVEKRLGGAALDVLIVSVFLPRFNRLMLTIIQKFKEQLWRCFRKRDRHHWPSCLI